MPLKTPEEYLESIKRDLNLYMFGEKVNEFWKHPIIKPSINTVMKIYELAQIEEYKDLMTVKSHLTGVVSKYKIFCFSANIVEYIDPKSKSKRKVIVINEEYAMNHFLPLRVFIFSIIFHLNSYITIFSSK